MTRQLNLWDNLNMSFLCISNHLSHLILWIISSMLRSIQLGSPCTYFCKKRVRIDLDTPALIFCQMPMQHIHLVQRKVVNRFFNECDIHKMPTTIQQQPPMFKIRWILNGDFWKKKAVLTSAIFTGIWHHQPERRKPPKQPHLTICWHMNDIILDS